MAEIKGLQDFFDPTKAMSAYVGMQQVGLHAQQLAQQQQQMAQQGKNLEIDNARQAFLTAVKENPIAAVAAWNSFAKPSGLQEMNNPSAFLANPQPFLDLASAEPGTEQHTAASQAISGMGESQRASSQKEAERRMLLGGGRQLAQAVGLGDSAEAGAVALHSGPLQTKAAETLVAQAQQAGTNAQLNGLVPINSQAQRGLSNLQPHTESLAALEQQKQQWTAKYGQTGAQQKMDEAVKLNPDLMKYKQQAQASVPQLEQQLQELRQKSDALNNDRILMATGAKPKGPEASPYVMTHQLQAAGFHERLLQAQLDLAKDPLNVAKHADVARASLDLNSHVQGLINGAITPEQVKAETINATNEAKQLYAALPPAKQTPQEAARIARQVQAKTGKLPATNDIIEGAKLANTPLVNVTNKIDTMVPASVEAQKEFMKSSRATYDQLKAAQPLLDNIERAKELIPQAKGFMGPGGETLLEAAKFLNNRVGLGVNTAGVKSAEELRSRIFFNIMDNLKKMDAQPSQQQQQIMQESLGKLGTDPNALPAVLDAYADVVRGKVEQYNEEVSGAEERGTKFPYKPQIRLKERAQTPQAPNAPTATGPGGQKLILKDGQWQPLK